MPFIMQGEDEPCMYTSRYYIADNKGVQPIQDIKKLNILENASNQL